MHRVCLCPESIAWIARHLQKSARATFRKMIKSGSIKAVSRAVKRRTKRRFSQKQLAAQRLFARRARAGTLRLGRKQQVGRFRRLARG